MPPYEMRERCLTSIERAHCYLQRRLQREAIAVAIDVMRVVVIMMLMPRLMMVYAMMRAYNQRLLKRADDMR